MTDQWFIKILKKYCNQNQYSQTFKSTLPLDI